jgi:diguanylate cyclase (GGDEF)-like protein
MKEQPRPDQALTRNYYGCILDGNYSSQLKMHLTECIKRFGAFDELSSPAIPYISAWENKQNIIWYEFVSRRFIALLGCDYASAPDFFRNSIIERHVYKRAHYKKGINEKILKSKTMKSNWPGLREEAKNKGVVEAVYKIRAADGKTLWLKDQAAIESFASDDIHLSLGTLTVVTKEMEAEEHLKRTQTALRKSEKKFRQQAIHDNLTGLYNTRYLYKALAELIVQSSSKGQLFSLIFMDIDNFKQVVDTHGHLNASQALQEIAATIEGTLQKPAYGVAYGGDEFVVVLPGFDKTQAAEMAEFIRSRIKETTYLQKAGLTVGVSASFGLSTFPSDARTLSDLLALADQAMFSVKERGKDSVCSISYQAVPKGDKTENALSFYCQK